MNILGIDFGTKNIGLAWVETGIGAVLPYGVIKEEKGKTKLKQLVDLVKQENIERVVFGLPIGLGGEENINTKRVRDFVEELKQSIDVPVEFMNEMFSSQQADRSAGGASRDEKSAMIILEDWVKKNN